MIRQEVLMLFVQGTKKILKNNLSKLIVYGYYAVEIIRKIRILML